MLRFAYSVECLRALTVPYLAESLVTEQSLVSTTEPITCIFASVRPVSNVERDGSLLVGTKGYMPTGQLVRPGFLGTLTSPEQPHHLN